MVIRHYLDYGVEKSASIIVSECILKGKSSGWAGNQEVEDVKRICALYNVFYVCDFHGTWERVDKE